MQSETLDLSAASQRRIHEAAVQYHESMAHKHRNMLAMILKHEAGDVSPMSKPHLDQLLDDIAENSLPAGFACNDHDGLS